MVPLPRHCVRRFFSARQRQTRHRICGYDSTKFSSRFCQSGAFLCENHTIATSNAIVHGERFLFCQEIRCNNKHSLNDILHSAKSNGFSFGKRDFREIAALLRCLGESKNLVEAKRLHAFLKRRGYDCNTYIGNCVIQTYGECGSIDDARAAFEVIQSPNLHSYNILIHAYALNGRFEEASTMFDYMCKRNVISWTSIISSAAEQGFYSEAMNFFHRMESEGISPNKITLISILEACSSLQEGFGIHISIVMRGYETDVIVATALIKMYGNFNGSSNAMYIFVAMPNKNVISWGAMITGLTQSGRAEEALEIFAQMSKQSIKLDEVIYVCALNACSDHGAFKEGQSLHVKIIEDAFDRHIIVGNALITLYGRFGDLDGATVIFMKMPIRNTGTWSAIISACAQHGESAEALKFFHQMILEGFQPLIPTYVSVLDACSDVMAWEMGRTVHSTVVKHGMEMDTYIGNSLVNLYGKCGRVTEAKSVFVGLKQCDVISWNNIILAFSQAGYGNEALEYFSQMLNDGIEPNNMTLKLTMEACTGISKVKRTYETMVGNLCKPNSIVEAHLMKQYRGCIDNEASREDQQVFEQNSTQHWECIDTEASRVNQQVFNQNSMQVNTTSHLCKTSGNMQVSCFTYQTKLFEIKQNEIVCATEKWDLYQRHLHDILASYPARKSFSSSNLAMDYYIGIIDILNHEGLLPEVEDLLISAPTAAAITSWSSLLCASRFHGDLHCGCRAADHCIVLNKDSASPYSELLQLYAATG